MASTETVNITLPNHEVRRLTAGPSSVLTKMVIEEFTRIHLNNPSVIWVSESGKKVVTEDSKLMADIGLPIDVKTLLPDIVIADFRPCKSGSEELLLMFIEVVATSGPFTQARKNEILKICKKAGYRNEHVLFISAFRDRNHPELKSRFDSLAVDSLIWCASEPEVLIWIGKEQEKPFVI